MIIRGTTPTLTAKLPIKCADIDACSMAFSQRDKLIFEKTLPDFIQKDDVLQVTLTEEETLLLECYRNVYIQFRIACGSARYVSSIRTEPVGPVLKEGCLIGTPSTPEVAPMSVPSVAAGSAFEVGLNEL